MRRDSLCKRVCKVVLEVLYGDDKGDSSSGGDVDKIDAGVEMMIG